MFNNIGKKIKTLVMVVFVLGCIGAVITMILIWMSIPSVQDLIQERESSLSLVV